MSDALEDHKGSLNIGERFIINYRSQIILLLMLKAKKSLSMDTICTRYMMAN